MTHIKGLIINEITIIPRLTTILIELLSKKRVKFMCVAVNHTSPIQMRCFEG